MKNTVLLVVDVQNAIVEEHPFNELTVISNIKDLIKSARDEGIEVVMFNTMVVLVTNLKKIQMAGKYILT